MPRTPPYAKSVFVNCPFDDDYLPLMEAIVFAMSDCGFVARSAQELDDAGEVRFEKIIRIIEESKYGIHDISRTELNDAGLPRFNMPLELGIFLGARRLGSPKQKQKVCLVLDREPYRYQQFISDIAGQDIKAHHDDLGTVIRIVRDWIRSLAEQPAALPGGKKIARRYTEFRADLPEICKTFSIDPDEVTFNDYTQLMTVWLRDQAGAT